MLAELEVEGTLEISREEAYAQLEKLTNRMDVPKYNTRKAQWLSKNLGTRNSNHPNFKEASELVDLILKRGW